MLAKSFFKLVLCSALVLPLLYGLVVNFWFIRVDTFPTTYKYWLLEKIESPKVVVTSGSNAYVGLDAAVLEDYFKVPVINLADVGAYPIYARMRAVEHYLKAGDTLVLPLEFVLYTRDGAGGYPTYGFKVAAGIASEYFRETDFIDRVRLTYFYMPPSWVARTIFDQRELVVSDNFRKSRLESYMRETLQEPGETRGSKFIMKSRGPGFMGGEFHCDDYIFGNVPDKYQLGKSFIKAMESIKRIKDSGVNVIFTYPGIVDLKAGECLSSPKAGLAMAYMASLSDELAALGIPLVGKQSDFLSAPEYFHDSYFHVLKAAAQKRAEKLVEIFAQANIKPYENSDYQFDDTTALIRKKIVEDAQ